MADDVTGTGHTVLGVNAFQGAINQLTTATDKLTAAADKMSTSATTSGKASSSSGAYGLMSQWLLNGVGSNGGSPTFNGQPASSSGGSHRSDAPVDIPGRQQAGNFAAVMARGNGGGVVGAYNLGNAVGGTKVGMVAGGTAAAAGAVAWGANAGASAQDMQNANMMGATATRMYTQGHNSFTMNGVNGSQGASDFYGGMFTLNSQSGYTQGSAKFNKMQSQVGAMGVLDPNSSATQNSAALVGFSSNTTSNLMRAFGLNTFNKDPIQIARQLLNRLGAPKGKIDPKVAQMVVAPQSGLSTTLNNMIGAGAIDADQAQAIKVAAYNLLMAQNQGMGAGQLNKLTQAASGDPKSAATKTAMAQMKAMHLGGADTSAQTMMTKSANATDDSAAQLDSFSKSLTTSTNLLMGLAKVLGGIPGVQKAMGASSGAGNGALGKVFGVASLMGSWSPLSMGLNILGHGDGSSGANGGMSIGGGDSSMMGGYSEVGALSGGGTSGGGMSGAGLAGAGLALGAALSTGSTTGFTSGSSGSGTSHSGSSGYSGSTGSSGSTGTGNGSIHYGTSQGVPTGSVSPGQAVARIRADMANHVDIGVGWCQKNVQVAYGWMGGGPATALAAWNAAKYKHTDFKSDPPPVGAFVYWGNGAGHVAIYAGGGQVYSPGGPGDLSHWVLCSIASITTGWGKPLLGWSEDNPPGMRRVRPATTRKQSHSVPHTGGAQGRSASGQLATGGHGSQSEGMAHVGNGAYGSMVKTNAILPGIASGGNPVAGSVTRTGMGSGHTGASIVFGRDSVHVHFHGDAGSNTAATGKALGAAFAQEFAQDQRVKALMNGTRN